MMMRTLPMLASTILLTLTTIGGTAEMQFTVKNPAEVAQRTIARIALPVPAGEIEGAPEAVALKGADAPAQAHVITRHPDGSVRRLMLSVPVSLAAGEKAVLECDPTASVRPPAPMLSGEEPARIKTAAYDVIASRGRAQILDNAGRVLAIITPFGPVEEDAETTLTVLDAGSAFVWLRYSTENDEWSREVDVQVDRLGEITLTHRVQVHMEGNHWTPDFGFDIYAPGGQAPDCPAEPVYFMHYDYSARFVESPDLVLPMTLADGTAVSVANPLAIRQNRGTLTAETGMGPLHVRSNRNEPVKNLEEDGLMIQEGQWRVSSLAIAPVGRSEMAAQMDEPLRTHADWRLYDAVYHTGAPLDLQSPLLREAVDSYVDAMQQMSISGDDWGNMTSWSPQRSGQSINSMVRYNHCRYVWEDYFRSGDPRLLDIARDWSENYRNLSVYWGPNEESYGGSRRGRALRNEPGSPHGPGTYMVRYNLVQGWLTKGFAAFYLAWEETGDPRFREAALKQARWSADTMTCLNNELRSIGGVADYAKLYEYTGDSFHLEQAVRLWEEFQQCQMDNLLFTQHGKEAVGDHLYIHDDSYGYKHQFVKPYMVQYATNSLPYLLEHTPEDQRLRDTIIALNDWMATHRQPGGGWGYPHYLTAGMGWNNEYSHGIALATELEPKEIYLEAIRENVAPVVQMLDLYGELPKGLNPWEYDAGINAEERAERYELATDRDPMPDYERGEVNFGQSPDNTVYFAALLRDYLEHRSEASLFESTELIEKMKRLPTTLDPTVVPPARVAMGEDGEASISVTVNFKAPGPQRASAEVVNLPAGVTAEPAVVEWSVERGHNQSPPVILRGTVAEETPITIRWQVGEGWEGSAEAVLAPEDDIAADGRVGYISGEGDPLALALAAIDFSPPLVSSVTTEELDGFEGLVIGGEAHAKNFAGLADAPERLLDFVRAGGNVAIFQLQDAGWREDYLPLPLSLSNDSSTVGEITAPEDAIFNEPGEVGSLAGAMIYDTIVAADPGWEVLAVDESDQPAILRAQAGEGQLLVVQPSVDRYLSGTLTIPDDLSLRDCTNLLRNVLAFIG